MKKWCVILAVLCISVTGLGMIHGDYSAHAAKTTKSSPVQLSQKVDINTADVAILTELPGIGPKTAAAITDFRKKNGKFAAVEDLLKIKGIGDKKLAKIKPYLAKI